MIQSLVEKNRRDVRIVFLIGLAGVVLAVIGTCIADELAWVRFFDNAHWTLGTATAAVLAVLGQRHGLSGEARWRKWFSLGLIGYALGQLVWDAQILIGYTAFPAPSDLLYLWLGPCIVTGLWMGIRDLATPAQRKVILLDMMIFTSAVVMLVLSVYLPKRGELDALSLLVMVAYPVTLLAATAMAGLTVLSLRLPVRAGWLVLVAAMLSTGGSWMLWNNMALDGVTLDGYWLNSTFSFGVLALGWAVTRIRFKPSADPAWDRLCEGLLRLLPLVAVVMAAMAVVAAHELVDVPDIVQSSTTFGAVLVILLAMLRQSSLLQERDQLLAEQIGRNKAEEALRLSEERWKFALEGAGDGMWDWDLPSGRAYFSPRWKAMLGYADHELENVFTTWDSLLYEDDKAATVGLLESCLSGKTPLYKAEFRLLCKGGGLKWIMARGMVIKRDADGKPLRVIGTHTDIDAQKTSEEIIWKQANFDLLTGLPNRRMFLDRIGQEVMKAQRAGERFAVLFIDLDQFKEVNDTLCHAAGDRLLIEAAQRVRSCVRDSDTVARLGGDEFTVLLSRLRDNHQMEVIAESIIRKLSDPFNIGKEPSFVSASIGITLYPDDAHDVEQLIKNADQAMYLAKSQGRNRYSYFTSALQEMAQKRMRLISELRGALGAGQLTLHFQPIVHMASGRIDKAEALLRWQHPVRGMISPAEFIPLLEETGLIHEIGDWVFREGANFAQRWSKQCPGGFAVSINVSPMQFYAKSQITKRWADHIRQAGLDGGNIVVEITEGLLLNPKDNVAEQLLVLRDAGVQVAIDDFGTGYSSLSYLKKFHIDYLKIDQSFVHNLEADTDNLALSEAIVVMAHKLGLKVVAEGVETESQRKLLTEMGCDYAQGYLYSRPVASAEFEKLLG